MEITVQLKNISTDLISAEANTWRLRVVRQSEPGGAGRAAYDIPILDPITLDVPEDWFPLRFHIQTYEMRVIQIGITRTHYTTFQSCSVAWLGYIGEVYIPYGGSYYFNCSTKRLYSAFAPGSTKTAILPVTVKPSGLEYTVVLNLLEPSGDVVASNANQKVSSGEEQDIQIPITLPQGGTYTVDVEVRTKDYYQNFVKGELVIS